MTRYVFLDTETTGLNPRIHEMWELAYQIWDTGEDDTWPESRESEAHFQFPIDLRFADSMALSIGKYFERCKAYPNRNSFSELSAVRFGGNSFQGQACWAVARELSTTFQGVSLVAANPAFDARFIEEFLFKQGFIPNWSYHLIDIRALVAGYLAGEYVYAELHDISKGDYRPPWRGKREQVAAIFGLDLSDPRYEEHTAKGDMNLVIEQFKIVMGY